MKKVHIDKKGREFIKDAYYVGGKIKFNRIYVIDGIPADEFYKKNATDMDFYMNGDYELMSSKKDSNIHFDDQNNKKNVSRDNEEFEDLPF